MRARKVYENVQFQRGFDPKEIMGIGLIKKRDFKDSPEFIDWIIKILPHILGEDKIPEDILSCEYWGSRTGNSGSGHIPGGMYEYLLDWLTEASTGGRFSIGGKEIEDWYETHRYPALTQRPHGAWPYQIANKLESKIVNEIQ